MARAEPGQGGCRLIIGVAGGSGSGKSLFARALAERLHPRQAVLISEDDYYRRVEGVDFDPCRSDFDAPEALDHSQLAEHLARLREGLSIDRPVYSFRIHAPLKRRVRVAPAEVVIVEGRHVLHDAGVRGSLDFSFFLDVDGDVRFIRRLLRDTRERGRSVKSVTDQYLATVKPAHDRFVQPSAAVANLLLAYDPGESDSDALTRWLDRAAAALETHLSGEERRMSDELVVRDIRPEDRSAWTPLWDGYNAFYGRHGPTALAPEITETTWGRFFDPVEPVHALIAEKGGVVLGIVHYLFHRSTTAIALTCYLQDLFTTEAARGQGVGRALITEVYARARAAGSSRVYWQTHESNAVAQVLYDKVSAKSGFIVYRTEV